MQHEIYNERETLSLDDGVVFMDEKQEFPLITLLSLVEDPLRKGAEQVRLSIGERFCWDLSLADIDTFHEELLARMDPEHFPWNDQGELETQVKLLVITGPTRNDLNGSTKTVSRAATR